MTTLLPRLKPILALFSPAPQLRAFLILTSVAMLNLAGSVHAAGPDGQMVSRNEEAKAELYYYVEYKAAVTEQTSVLKGKTVNTVNPFNGAAFVDVDLGSGTAPAGSPWLTSTISKIENEIAINRIYKLPPLTGTNVERYRYRLMPPSGYETYFRVAGSEAAFQPGSIFEETLGGPGFEIVVMPINQSGALPGKSTSVNPTDGSMSFALGFLTNGRSAGFLDFLPKIDYRKEAGTSDFSVSFGRALSCADLNYVRLSDEVEVISMLVPDFDSGSQMPATNGVRQVITPQSVVDIKREGFD
jgi:hypothetical protein